MRLVAALALILCEAIKLGLCDLLKKNLSACRNEGSLLSTYNQLKTCIDWLGTTCSTDETMLAASNITSMTRASVANTRGTINTMSKTSSLITDVFDFIKNFIFQNILVTGVNGIKSLMSSYYFCIKSTPTDV